MTDLQIRYQQLQLERNRVQEELALNQRQLDETTRHNLATEEAAKNQLEVSWHQAWTARQNADTNRLNYGVNLMNAETNRLNYGVNAMNAQTNARNAAVNERNAATNEYNAYINRLNYGINLARASADIALTRAQAQDVEDKHRSNYWDSVAFHNYTSGASSAANAVNAGIAAVGTVVKAAGLGSGASAASRAASASKGAESAASLAQLAGSVSYLYDVVPLGWADHAMGTGSPLEDYLVWSQTGKHLYELSDAEGKAIFGAEWNSAKPKMTAAEWNRLVKVAGSAKQLTKTLKRQLEDLGFIQNSKGVWIYPSKRSGGNTLQLS